MTNRFLQFAFGVISLSVAGVALHATPISSCTLNTPGNPSDGFTCNLYESDDKGNPSEISSVLLPSSVTTGFIVLLEDPSGSQTDPSNWSDVLDFPDTGGGVATTAFFYSQGCNVAPGDTSCFPALASAPHVFINEDPSGVTTWTSRPNSYLLNSAPDVPEPASMSLLAAGLAGLGLFAKKLR